MRIWALCATLLATSTVTAAPNPLRRFDSAGAGFIDDAMALREDGNAVAFITTDGATTATLHLADIVGSEAKVPGAPPDATALHWLSPGRVLVVRGGEGGSTAQLFTASGADKAKLGPFGQLTLANVDGKRAIVTYTRSDKHGVEHTVVAYSPETLKPLKRRSWREDSEGQIKQGVTVLKPLWWAGGYTVLAALRAGEFDKARDMRRPDRYARLDSFSGKLLDENEVKDILAFTQVGLLRRDAPNQPVIAHYSDDHRRLLFTDGIDQYDVKMPRDIWKYDPNSLQWQTLDDKRAAVSLTVDPVNPDAVNRKKAEADEIDLVEVDRQGHAVRPLLRLAGEGRRATWKIAGNRLLLLRKGKGFDRGGVALEVYDLSSEPSVAKP
ncbi:MAG: hypothetical protein JWN44_4827 [Myxococcales bacterium]|nr:hypothetical protein [Myxococcales bacterium]